jgi:hypothetical protein
MGIEILERYIPYRSGSSKAVPQVAEAAQRWTGMTSRIQSKVSSLCILLQFLQRNHKALSGIPPTVIADVKTRRSVIRRQCEMVAG